MKRILCPVDFSEASRRAIDHAIGLAHRYRASLTALHVANPALRSLPELAPMEHPFGSDELTRLHRETAAAFSRAMTAGLCVDVRVEIGRTDLEIVETATGMGADLIVMGTHGHGGFEHVLLGSVAEKVLRRAPCPVLTVPPHAPGPSALPYRRLLCAIDFSEWSLTAFELASSLAEDSHASLIALHVVEWPWSEPQPPRLDELPENQAEALAEYRRYVETSAADRLEMLVRDRPETRTHVTHGKAYREILRAAREMHADAIVMGVHGRSRFDMMFGSTTNQVVRHAECPVLTVRR